MISCVHSDKSCSVVSRRANLIPPERTGSEGAGLKNPVWKWNRENPLSRADALPDSFLPFQKRDKKGDVARSDEVRVFRVRKVRDRNVMSENASLVIPEDVEKLLAKTSFRDDDGFSSYLGKLFGEFEVVSTGNQYGGGSIEYFFCVDPERLPQLKEKLESRMKEEGLEEHIYIEVYDD